MSFNQKIQIYGLLWCLAISATTFAHAEAFDELPYRIDVVRQGKAHHQLAINFWQGEYPQPVIDVHANRAGRTLISGYVSLRDKTQRKACLVQNGLYHPWSKNPTSALGFYTLTGVESYRVTRAPDAKTLESFELNGSELRVGDKVVNVVYTAEGNSVGVLESAGHKSEQIGFASGALTDAPQYFSQIEFSDAKFKDEQWLYLQCVQGYKVFVQDTDLLMQKGIRGGQILSYGEIASANF